MKCEPRPRDHWAAMLNGTVFWHKLFSLQVEGTFKFNNDDNLSGLKGKGGIIRVWKIFMEIVCFCIECYIFNLWYTFLLLLQKYGHVVSDIHRKRYKLIWTAGLHINIWWTLSFCKFNEIAIFILFFRHCKVDILCLEQKVWLPLLITPPWLIIKLFTIHNFIVF